MKELTTETKQALLAPFQAAETRLRLQPYVAAYVTARVVMTRLDEVLPFQWSFKLPNPPRLDKNGVMEQDGILLVHTKEGLTLEFHDRGSAPGDIAKGQAKQAKHAVSDCFKRCAVHVGVGRYLYELQGVQAGAVPKAGLEKALAAVGFHGPWDDRHHGRIGGIREADAEDDDVGVEPAQEEARPAPRPHPAANGQKPAVKVNVGQAASIVSTAQKGQINVDSDEFKAWLRDHTSNGVEKPEDVLIADLPKVLAELEKALAAVGFHGPWDDRHHGRIGGIREADAEDDDVGVEPAQEEARPAPRPHPAANGDDRVRAAVKASEEDKNRINEAVEYGGGNIASATFLGWLTKNTANKATSLNDVLSEDVEELVRKLNEYADKRNKRKPSGDAPGNVLGSETPEPVQGTDIRAVRQ